MRENLSLLRRSLPYRKQSLPLELHCFLLQHTLAKRSCLCDAASLFPVSEVQKCPNLPLNQLRLQYFDQRVHLLLTGQNREVCRHTRNAGVEGGVGEEDELLEYLKVEPLFIPHFSVKQHHQLLEGMSVVELQQFRALDGLDGYG